MLFKGEVSKMKRTKLISSVLVLTIFVQSLAASYARADGSPSETNSTASFKSCEEAPQASSEECVEVVVHTPPAREQAIRFAPEHVVIDTAPAQEVVVDSMPTHGESNDVADMRQHIPKITWKGKVIMGTLVTLLIAGGVLLGLYEKGKLGNNNNPGPLPPLKPGPKPGDVVTSINFSGYDFLPKEGGPWNMFSNSRQGISLNSQNQLVLKVFQKDGEWKQTEVAHPSTGYGTYEYKILATPGTPNLRSSFIVYKNELQAFEIGVGAMGATNGTFIVQPNDVAGNQVDFAAIPSADGFANFRMSWTPSGIKFEAIKDGNVISTFDYKGTSNFAPDSQTFTVFKQWLLANSTAPNDGFEHGATFDSFKFTPMQ
jgi:hypothetical protein